MKKITLLMVSILLLGTIAYADCEYRGIIYPEGAIRGPYICVDTNWVRR